MATDGLPYARRKILVIMAITTSLFNPNSCAIWFDTGANIEEDTGVIKVKAETMAVAAHLRSYAQLDVMKRTNDQTEEGDVEKHALTSWDSQDHRGLPSQRRWSSHHANP
jgi:hypothetical protein